MTRLAWLVVCVAAFLGQRPECAAKAEASPPDKLQPPRKPPPAKKCDPAKWTASKPSEASLIGSWVFIDGAHYTYRFDGHGHFSSVEEPGCAFATRPCELRVAPHPGTYVISGSEVRLSYDKGAQPPSQGTVTLSAMVNCKGESRLRGKDYNQAVTLRM